jgi:hypothetical protein
MPSCQHRREKEQEKKLYKKEERIRMMHVFDGNFSQTR